MTVPKILIVDDNQASRELMLAVLKRLSCDILQACHGEEAYGIIIETRPDLVLLDLEMPLMDGIAVVRKLRQDPRFASMPVLAVTADAMPGTGDKVLAEGFSGYVTKPIDASQMRERVRKLLEI